MFDLKSVKVCVIGLGYVGLPLAIEFGKKFNTIGFDLNQNRVKQLNHKYEMVDQLITVDYNTFVIDK